MTDTFKDYLPEEYELVDLVEMICDDMGVPVPNVTFYQGAIALTTPELNSIRLPARSWLLEHQALHASSCYWETALHEAAHWVLWHKDRKNWQHTRKFFAVLFAMCDIYGPEDYDEASLFVLRAYEDEVFYIPRFATPGWADFIRARNTKGESAMTLAAAG